MAGRMNKTENTEKLQTPASENLSQSYQARKRQEQGMWETTQPTTTCPLEQVSPPGWLVVEQWKRHRLQKTELRYPGAFSARATTHPTPAAWRSEDGSKRRTAQRGWGLGSQSSHRGGGGWGSQSSDPGARLSMPRRRGKGLGLGAGGYRERLCEKVRGEESREQPLQVAADP